MKRFVKYLVLCFCLVFSITLMGVFSSDISVGFLGWIAFLFFGTAFVTVGSYLGSLFRDFAAPDVFLSSGAVDTFFKRVFWMVGPQFIGGVIGVMAAQGFLVNVLGFYQFAG